jgi:hypothetical protein
MSGRPPFPKLERPVSLPLTSTFVAPALLDQEAGRSAIGRAVREGFLRPFDIERAEIDEPSPLWVPFWRVEVSVDGLHLTLPSGASRYKDVAVMIHARADFPYEAKLSSVVGRVSGVPPITVEKAELTSPAELPVLEQNGAVVLDADVVRARAESTALGLMLAGVSPAHAIYPKYEPKIEGASFVLYPVYYAGYAYNGEARRPREESMFVAVCGRTGRTVAARHPSAVRSVAAKVRRFLSFDRRV